MDIPRIGYGALYRPPQVGFGRAADGAQDQAGDPAETKALNARTPAAQTAAGPKAPGTPLSDDEQKQVNKLKAIDTKVRQHEAAHQAAGGALAGGASFTYAKGPDGRSYAVGGEVPIRAPAARSPDTAIQQAQQIKAAALAPAEPSGQDLSVAAAADASLVQAQRELKAAGNTNAQPGAGTPPGTGSGGEAQAGERPAGRQAVGPGSEPVPGLPAAPVPAVGQASDAASAIPALVARGVAAYGAASRINEAPRYATALFA